MINRQDLSTVQVDELVNRQARSGDAQGSRLFVAESLGSCGLPTLLSHSICQPQ